MNRSLPFVVLLCLAISCASTDAEQSALPEHGLGLISVDQMPPPGAQIFVAPVLLDQAQPNEVIGQALAIGTELIYRRGGKQTAHFRIEAKQSATNPASETQLETQPETLSDSGWNLVDVGTGVKLRYSDQWTDLGKDLPDDRGPLLIFDPGDPILHFPLWVGKTWGAHFISRAGRRDPIVVEVNYHCDGLEWVSTPAGRFHCLRIWRRAQLAGSLDSYGVGSNVPESGEPAADIADSDAETSKIPEAEAVRQRISLYWYAPKLGIVVKRLDDSELLELIDIRK